MPETTLHYAPTPADYCRKARRLRSLHQNDPARLHEALGRLRLAPQSRKNCRLVRHRGSEAVEWISPETRAAGSASRFAELVASRMDGPILRYSARLSLFREAARRKIDRFEANLIIAAVQHQAGPIPKPRQLRPRRTLPLPMIVAILLVVEGLSALAVWHFISA